MTLDLERVLVGMGNPLLDISAEVDEAFLSKYGLKANDATLADPEKHKDLYTDLVSTYASKVQYIAGGATQNSIRGAQWMLPANSTSYFGCVGTDDYGKIMRNAAEKDGVNVCYMELPAEQNVPTGTCAVLITQGGQARSLVANLSAANHYKVDHIKQAENWKLVTQAKYFYSSGFFLTVSVDTMLAVAKHAVENNKTFALNLSAPFLCQFFKDQMLSVLPYANVVFGNESEALAFAENNGIESKDIAEIAQKIADWEHVSRKPRMVVITQGHNPTIVAHSGQTSIMTVPVIPIAKEHIVDTNGAGDAFVGGFLSQLVRGRDVKKCVDAGNYLANIVIKRNGATLPDEKCSYE
ncbi:hypothetical protein MP228_006709 [Amoeboaphelidium protococcarum]|nr:hypothetical protein MP228_006709 [Amoeboaphelidium protococcarum]